MNSAGESYLGYKSDETLGKPMQEAFLQDPLQANLITSHLKRGREWQGNITIKRKHQESLIMPCKAVGVNCAGK